ncbi:SDR family oxidoreductase [Dinghuibacter silviterrae]|uniref:UDP-N-acetylglucosamine 4-epimerase n=1 Tax=Dinghuibacter silviterrae TaxID=1539049 RepID=A0A4R8DPL7_9BACT|nr:SDR family oxidoreductase [Dinghuibacter silviterrae]TDX00032.1 UDP-N-acetylglucosamine 4-epimerase [Dinghuibacter silviterrae]
MFEHPFHTGSLSDHSFLVTGGAGFIGSNLVEYLVRHKAGRIRVLDNLSTGHLDNLREFRDYPGFEWMEGDIRDMDTCRRACEGIQFVSHQAALGSVPRSVKDPVTTNDVNITGHLHVLQAARESGSTLKMVYAASSSTYGDSRELPKVEDRIGNPLSPYAVTKFVNERYAQVFSDVYGFHTVGLRYFNVFGPRQDPDGPYAAVIPLFIRAALQGNAPTINGDGEQTRDFTFVENAVQANILALLKGRSLDKHEVFNIAYGRNITLNGLWRLLTAQTGTHRQPTYGPPRQGDIKHSLADIGKAARMLDYAPRFDIEKGLSVTLEWYRHES